jgi:hypothetical protein
MTPVWPGSRLHETLMFPRTLRAPLAVRVARWMTTAPTTTLACPVWLSRTEGVEPDAGTASGPEPVDTLVRGTVSSMFSLMSPCGAMISALTSAVPSIHSILANLTTVRAAEATVAATSTGRLGVRVPTVTDCRPLGHTTVAVRGCPPISGSWQEYWRITGTWPATAPLAVRPSAHPAASSAVIPLQTQASIPRRKAARWFCRPAAPWPELEPPMRGR